MTSTTSFQYLWVLQGIMAILVIFGVSLLYTPVAELSLMLHTAVTLATPVDLAIPLVPPAIIIYWYVFYTFIFFSYVYLSFVQREYRNAMLASYVLVSLVAYAIYLLFPVQGPPRTVTGTDFFSMQIALLYQTDVHVNCFPSLHGSTSLLAAYSLSRARREYGYLAWPVALAVILSTLLVRQHWIVDQFAAALVTLPIAYFFFERYGRTRVTGPTGVPRPRQVVAALAISVIAMALYIWSFQLTA